jgi:anti-sigma-K factor RskA
VTVDNLHLLAGAYALDALPLDERAFFERHLATCETCCEEVVGYLHTAAAMGMAVRRLAPASLRARVMAEVERTRQPSPLHRRSRTPAGGPHQLVAVAGLLAAALVSLAAVAFSVLESRQPPAMSPEFVAVAETVRLDAPDGVHAKLLYSVDRDEGYLVATGLDPLGPDRDYQLWVLHDGAPVPAGVFDAEADTVVPVDASLRDAEGLAVTAEPAGGVPEPTGTVLLSAAMATGSPSDGGPSR